MKLGVPALALFPVVDQSFKNRTRGRAWPRRPGAARGAGAEEGIPELGVITDVALDPYTIHGQDGLIDASTGLRAQRRDARRAGRSRRSATPRPVPMSSRRRT